ncbi:MAG: KUP/HAK/KT family potassium transporter, partial [Solirubrobacteraceae bacterium]
PPVRRVPGTAIFMNPGKVTTPLALRAEVEHNGVIHDHVVIVSVDSVGLSHVDKADRLQAERIGEGLFKVVHVTVRSGYQDTSNVPMLLALARKKGLLPRNLDLEHASYFVSRMIIAPTDAPGMSRWRKRLFVFMARNATSPITHFHLPDDRTVMMGSQVNL